jgi:phage terminase small subunit
MTDAQRVFADEYLLCFNATKAYKFAYPNIKNDKVAGANGHRLLKNAEISEYIGKKQHEMQIMAGVTREMLMQEINAIAFSDIGNYLTIKKGKIKLTDTDKMTPFQRKALAGAKRDKFGALEIKLHDKLRGLEMAAKLYGFDRMTAEDEAETGVILLPPIQEDDGEEDDP